MTLSARPSLDNRLKRNKIPFDTIYASYCCGVSLIFMRKIYIGRFVGRVFALFGVTVLLFLAPEQFDVLEGGNFFKRVSLLHILWFVWLTDMLTPVGSRLAFAIFVFVIGRIAIRTLMKVLKKNHMLNKTEGTVKTFALSFVNIGLYVLLTISMKDVTNILLKIYV